MKNIAKAALMLSVILASSNTYSFTRKSICGDDDRQPSDNPKIARSLKNLQAPNGCSITMISSNCAISAGHCTSTFGIAQFHTPASDARGRINHSLPENTYKIVKDSIVYRDRGPGNDWAVMRLEANEITGKNPGDVQGYYGTRFFGGDVKVGDVIRITGYGRDYNDSVRNFAQQSHSGEIVKIRNGALYHIADTTGGNSGSAVIRESDEKIVAIHTHAGCSSGGNKSTYIKGNDELQKAIVACVVQDM